MRRTDTPETITVEGVEWIPGYYGNPGTIFWWAGAWWFDQQTYHSREKYGPFGTAEDAMRAASKLLREEEE